MSRGSWGIVFALVGWLVLSAQAPQPKAEAERDRATASVGRAVPPVARPPARPTEPVNLPVDSHQYQQRCERAEDNRNSDLCAQWKAADAARDAADYARTQLWIAVGGIGGLLATLILTLMAVKAARASVTVAQQTADRQLRAYIDLKKGRLVQEIGEHRLRLWVANFGQTPASNVTYYSTVVTVPWPIVELPEAEAIQNSGGTLPPGHARRLTVPITKADYEKVEANLAVFVFAVRVSYDVLDGLESREFKTWLFASHHELRRRKPRYVREGDRPQGKPA